MTRHRHDDEIGAAIAAAVRSVRAPAELRERVAAQHARRRARARRWTLRAATGAATAVALAVALALTTGGGPTVRQVAVAALQPPTRPAPPDDARDARFIAAEVGGVRFPDYEPRWGWKAVGARTDRVSGRRAVTVIYRKAERGVHYTIVEGEPLPLPDGARRVVVDGAEVAVLRDHGARLVAWHQGGRTCVLASRTVGTEQLLRFAAWQ